MPLKTGVKAALPAGITEGWPILLSLAWVGSNLNLKIILADDRLLVSFLHADIKSSMKPKGRKWYFIRDMELRYGKDQGAIKCCP